MKIYWDIDQSTDEWSKLRCGKITGTRVSSVFKSNNLTLLDEIIAERETKQMKSFNPTWEVRRGMEMEPLAISHYATEYNTELHLAGFIQGDNDWHGHSPDALIKDKKGTIVKGLEVKCLDTRNHVTIIRQNKIPAKYFHQVLNYFLVCPTITEVDFISFDPRFTCKPMHVVTLKKEDVQDEIDKVIKGLDKFWKKVEDYHLEITF